MGGVKNRLANRTVLDSSNSRDGKMKRVKLWTIGKRNGSGTWTAVDVTRVENADTESLLESLLTDSPQLLMDGLKLVGRQIPTEGGPS